MDSEKWKNTYIYGKEYEEVLRKFIADKIASGQTLALSDFSSIDMLRPTKNDVIGEFFARYNVNQPQKVLDMGCGLGGTSRFLANLGHSITGCDVLPQFIELGNQINSLVGMSHLITLQNTGVFDAQVEPASFDVVITTGVLLILPGQESVSKLASYVRPGGFLYVEDYYLVKETELSDSEQYLLNDYHKYPIRKKSEYIENFTTAGLEIVEIVDLSKYCSDFAWSRGERILKSAKDGKAVLEAEINTYGINCPKLLAHLEHLSQEELEQKYPNVCERIGTDSVYSNDKLLTWVGWVLRKLS